MQEEKSNQSKAKSKWWASKPKSERSKIMSARVKLYWTKQSPEAINLRIRKMVKARLAKLKAH